MLVHNDYAFEAPDEELMRVARACDEFRRHCTKYPSMPFASDFTGQVDDIAAMDYLDYEIGLPPGDYEAATLVWGNVLVCQIGFRWVCSYRGDLLLTWSEPGDDDRVVAVVWPFALVLEALIGGNLRPEGFGGLTQKVIERCQAEHPTSPGFQTRLRQFAANLHELPAAE